MKTLVVFYSRTGRTRRVAEYIASKTNSALEELVDRKKRKGTLGFISAGLDGMKKREASIKEPLNDPTEYGLVILGTPVWMSSMAPAVRTYLSRFRHGIREAGFFCCCGHNGSEKAMPEIQSFYGRKPRACMSLNIRDLSSGDYRKKTDLFLMELEHPRVE